MTPSSHKTRSTTAFLVQSVSAGLALAFIIVMAVPTLRDRVLAPPAEPVSQRAPVASYADAVDRAAPSVVSIYTQSLELQEISPQLQRMLGRQYLQRARSDMGSGVLMSDNGHILTNHHVINGVENIQVGLWDNRFAPAQVIGSDPATDLAVLKIDLEGLPAAPLGSQFDVRVGDVVLAIGNALGFSHSVTMGIVSATGRNDLNAVLFEDFIQTDAAINAGNSGGALVNATGEVIGINARSLGRATGGQNIGFAIPMDLAVNVMNQIIDHGGVQRGWLGANFMDLPLTGLPDGSAMRRGIRVIDVVPGGPAWNAGLRGGDILLASGGDIVDDTRAFLFNVASMAPGDQLDLTVQRGMDVFETYADLVQQPPAR